MKRVIIFILISLGFTSSILAQSSRIEKMIAKEQVKQQKALIRARSQQVEKEIKKFSQDGWTIDGTAKSTEVAFREYYQKLLLDPNYRELQSNASGSSERSLNLVQNIALNNAMVKYAQEAKSHVEGRVINNMGQENDAELENFYSAYERAVTADIEGELEFQFGFYRDDQKTNKREYVAFYLINEQKASEKRIKAMETALKETQTAQKTAEEISAFIKEGFRTDEARDEE